MIKRSENIYLSEKRKIHLTYYKKLVISKYIFPIGIVGYEILS